jgi:hypothetical protein
MGSIAAQVKNEASSAFVRVATAVGLVVGVASFFYALSKDDRQRWIWIIVAVIFIAVAGKYVVVFVVEVSRRYLNFDRNLGLLGQAQSDLIAADIKTARRAGLDEGIARVTGTVLSIGSSLQPRNFSMSAGSPVLSAEVLVGGQIGTTGEKQVPAKARFALIYADTDELIAIMSVMETGSDVTLRAAAIADDAAWSKFEGKAVLGEPAGAGLALRPSQTTDYEFMADSSAVEKTGV